MVYKSNALTTFIKFPNEVGADAEQDTNCIYPVNFQIVFGFTHPVTCYHIGTVKLAVSKLNTKLVNGGD